MDNNPNVAIKVHQSSVAILQVIFEKSDWSTYHL